MQEAVEQAKLSISEGASLAHPSKIKSFSKHGYPHDWTWRKIR